MFTNTELPLHWVIYPKWVFALLKNCWVNAKWMLHSTRFIVIPPRNGNCDEASPATAECINHFVYTQQFLSNAKLTLNLPIQTKFVAVNWGTASALTSGYISYLMDLLHLGAAECQGGGDHMVLYTVNSRRSWSNLVLIIEISEIAFKSWVYVWCIQHHVN